MTDSPLADELGLRFTEREVPLSPPDIAAFSGVDRALLREQLAQHDDNAPLADVVAAGLLATRTRVVLDSDPALAGAPVFVTLRGAPIPAIDAADPTGLDLPLPVDPALFALGDRVDGHLAWLPAPRPRSRPAAALLLAVAIPLAVPDIAAAQAPPVQQPAPAAAAVTVPEAPPPATPTPTPIATTAPTPAVRPQGPMPPQLAMQTILEAMKGQEAIVFARGGTVTGRIVGVDGDFVIMIDYDHDGKIAMIPKAEVLDVRGKVKKPPPPDMSDGTGSLAGGGVLVAMGAPLMLSGIVFLGIIPSSGVVYLPQVIPAAVLLGAGIPLLIRGTRQRRAYKAAYAGSIASRVSPSFGPTRGGWTGGLTLRF